MFKKMPNASNLLYTMLVAVLIVGCQNTTEDVNEEKSFDTIKMDLGMALWKNKIQTFEGDVIEKAEDKKEVDEKECG